MGKKSKVNPTAQRWIVVNIKKNKVDMVVDETMHYTRKGSIAAMLYNKSGRPAYSWQQLRKYGWRCVKVNLSFEI